MEQGDKRYAETGCDLSSESSIGEDSKWVKRQKLHYIGLSVKLDRRLYTTRTFSFYAPRANENGDGFSNLIEIVLQDSIGTVTVYLPSDGNEGIYMFRRAHARKDLPVAVTVV